MIIDLSRCFEGASFVGTCQLSSLFVLLHKDVPTITPLPYAQDVFYTYDRKGRRAIDTFNLN